MVSLWSLFTIRDLLLYFFSIRNKNISWKKIHEDFLKFDFYVHIREHMFGSNESILYYIILLQVFVI